MSALAEQYNAELVRRLRAEDALRSLANASEVVLAEDQAWSGEPDDEMPLLTAISNLGRIMGWTSVRDAIAAVNAIDGITAVKDDGGTESRTRPENVSNPAQRDAEIAIRWCADRGYALDEWQQAYVRRWWGVR